MTQGRLEGKVAVVTGATSGIGAVGAKRFAAEGAKVVVAGRNPTARQQIVGEIEAAGGTATFSQVDVGDPASVEQLIESTVARFGRLDVIYSNAGLHEWGTAAETSIDSWQRTIDVNLSGQFYLAKYGHPPPRSMRSRARFRSSLAPTLISSPANSIDRPICMSSGRSAIAAARRG